MHSALKKPKALQVVYSKPHQDASTPSCNPLQSRAFSRLKYIYRLSFSDRKFHWPVAHDLKEISIFSGDVENVRYASQPYCHQMQICSVLTLTGARNST